MLENFLKSAPCAKNETSGLLCPKRGAGGGASEKDGGGEQQVQTSHHHRRTLEKGLTLFWEPFWTHGILVPIEMEQNCEVGNRNMMFHKLIKVE